MQNRSRSKIMKIKPSLMQIWKCLTKLRILQGNFWKYWIIFFCDAAVVPQCNSVCNPLCAPIAFCDHVSNLQWAWTKLHLSLKQVLHLLFRLWWLLLLLLLFFLLLWLLLIIVVGYFSYFFTSLPGNIFFNSPHSRCRRWQLLHFSCFPADLRLSLSLSEFCIGPETF